MKGQREKLVTWAWGLIFILILLMAVMNLNAQIGTQFYLANDSCEFYLPDYSQAIEVRDNCCLDSTYFMQTPNSGTVLRVGEDVTVTLMARDCSGNVASMQFDVVVIDNVPPKFYYDTAQFAPLGMYQNEERVYKFWTSSEPDTTGGDPDLYYSINKTARDRTTGIGTEIHDAFYRNESYYKMSLFMAQTTYRVIDMYMALAKRGDPQGKLKVEIWQMNMSDTSLFQPICGGEIDLRGIEERISANPSDVQAEELIWHTVDVSDGILIRGGWYALRTYCVGEVNDENRVIWNTTNYDINNDIEPYQFLKYSYDSEETYGTNFTSSYMYQIWGVDL